MSTSRLSMCALRDEWVCPFCSQMSHGMLGRATTDFPGQESGRLTNSAAPAFIYFYFIFFISVALRLSPSPKCQLPSHWRDSKRTAGQKQNPDGVSQKLTCTEHMSNSWSNDSRTLTRTLRALVPIRVLDRNQGNKTCINSARGFQTRNVQTETNRGKLTADNFFESSKARKSLRDSSGLCKTNLAWIPESL